MARTGIALGSNLGDREGHLLAALAKLTHFSTPGAPVLVAPLFETAPVGCPEGSPSFLNTVVEIDWPRTPLELLEKTRALEVQLGRTANPIRNAPRVIDIDLLYCGDARLDSPALTLPHPRMALRRFVLMPLAAIRPHDPLPGHSDTPLALLGSLASDELPPTLFPSARWKNT